MTTARARIRGWLAGATLLTGLVAAGLWLRDRDPSPPTGETAPPIDSGRVATAAGNAPVTAAPALTANLPPLPPVDLAFDTTTAALQARADAGDRVAACRLGVGLLRCDAVRRREALLARQSYDSAEFYAESGALAMAIEADEQRLWNLEQLAQCKAVEAPLRERGTEYLARAARAGHHYAMAVYGSGLHLREEPGFAATREFDDWRRDAAAMLQRALEAGEPTAVAALTRGYATDLDYAEALVPNDPVRAHAMELLSARLFGTAGMNFHGRALDAAGLARARQLAERIHAESFQGRRFDVADSVNQRLEVAPRPGARANPCEPG